MSVLRKLPYVSFFILIAKLYNRYNEMHTLRSPYSRNALLPPRFEKKKDSF